MAFVETDLPCDKCGSSDAAAIDENGWKKCFACESNEKVSAFDEEADPTDGMTVSEKRRYERQRRREQGKTVPGTLAYREIRERRLERSTCQRYGVGYMGDDLYFPIGEGAQVRLGGEKQFRTVGNYKSDTKLFGQDTFGTSLGTRYIIVTEGQFDAMAAHQMMQSKTPAVSVRNGAGSAVRDVKNNYDFLDQFDMVIFAFDNDDPGIKAREECCEIFSHKAGVITYPDGCKDANDCLMKGKSAAFVKAFWNVQQWRPDGIIQGTEILDAVMTDLPLADALYPFPGLNRILLGLRGGELVMFTAGSGVGKSQLLREIAYNLLKTTPDNIGLMFMEEDVRKTALSIMSLAVNKPLHLYEGDDRAELKQVGFDATMGTGRVFLFDHFGSSAVENIIAKVRYLAKVCDCKYIFLDHISIIVSGGDNADERKVLDEVMTKLRTTVQETGVCLIAVTHLKRADGKQSHEEGAVTSLSQLRGSAGIAQLSDIVIGAERNGQADDPYEKNLTHLRVLKNRFSGELGSAGYLLYQRDTGRMLPEGSVDDMEDAL